MKSPIRHLGPAAGNVSTCPTFFTYAVELSCLLLFLFVLVLFFSGKAWCSTSWSVLHCSTRGSPTMAREGQYTRVLCFGKIIGLTHWGRVTHICVGKLTIIGSDNGLSPGRRQAIIWTSAGVLLIGPLGTNFSEIFPRIQTFSFKKMHLKMSSGKWRPFVSASMC